MGRVEQSLRAGAIGIGRGLGRRRGWPRGRGAAARCARRPAVRRRAAARGGTRGMWALGSAPPYSAPHHLRRRCASPLSPAAAGAPARAAGCPGRSPPLTARLTWPWAGRGSRGAGAAPAPRIGHRIYTGGSGGIQAGCAQARHRGELVGLGGRALRRGAGRGGRMKQRQGGVTGRAAEEGGRNAEQGGAGLRGPTGGACPSPPPPASSRLRGTTRGAPPGWAPAAPRACRA
jgi:hypothetical protein